MLKLAGRNHEMIPKALMVGSVYCYLQLPIPADAWHALIANAPIGVLVLAAVWVQNKTVEKAREETSEIIAGLLERNAALSDRSAAEHAASVKIQTEMLAEMRETNKLLVDRPCIIEIQPKLQGHRRQS
jgi:hypothetical protein